MSTTVLELPLREFNAWVKHSAIDETVAKQLRTARRRNKNRQYAKASRLRRSLSKLSLHLATVGARALAEVLAAVG